MRRIAAFPLLVFVGMLLMQAAWIVTVPPFRASDEFDHVYRAAGVALGDWRLTEDTAEGRGLLVTVPDDIVQAASAQCDYLPYPGPHNCFPVQDHGDGTVTVSTAAANYNPAYYLVLGAVGKPFEGATTDYVMRATSALLNALMAASAALCLSMGGAGRWMRFAFLATLSPVLIYTTIIPAPNGLEIASGIALWAALWGLACRSTSRRNDLAYMGVATVAGVVMATVRYIGPMWLGFIVIAVACYAGAPAVDALVRRSWKPLLVAFVIVTLAVGAGAWWTISADLVGPTEDRAEYGETVSLDLGLQPVVWILQMIAAFPLRGDVAPPEVYALYLLPVGALVVAATRSTAGRHRVTLLGLTAMVLLFPVLLTVLTAEGHGIIWQGRYQLGFAAGLLLLCGASMDEVDAARREVGRLTLVAATMLGLAHVRAVVGVLIAERDRPPSVADPVWPDPPWAVVALMVVIGYAILTWASRRVVGPSEWNRADVRG